MRKGVLTVEITNGAGDVTRLASRMYADSNTLFRGHLQGFSQTRRMTDALAGRTSMSVANLVIHNQNEEYDLTEFSGTVDIRIGAYTDTIAQMDDVMLDAKVEIVSRTDNEITISVLDGQTRGNIKQQRIFDSSGEGFGTLLPEIWGSATKFQLIGLDNAGLKYGCAGPIDSISLVRVNDIVQSSGFTTSLIWSTAVVEFTADPESPVTINAIGSSSALPGAMLYELITRVSIVAQGTILSFSGATVTLDERIDPIIDTLVGKSITILRPSGVGSTKTVTAFDAATRIATLNSAWTTDPVLGDMYEARVNTQSGGFTTSEVDVTGFDNLDTALPYNFGMVATDGINAIDFQDRLLSPLLCHMAPRRDGIVHLKRLTPPTGTAVKDITRIIGEITRLPMPVYWHVEARYRITSNEDSWKSASSFDASIKDLYPQSTTHSIDVLSNSRDAAIEISQHWLDCFGTPTELVTMTVDHDLSMLNLGDTVEVFDDRYQFSDGKYATVVSMTDVFDGYDQLTVWVASQ